MKTFNFNLGKFLRRGETYMPPFRTSRLFNIGNEWYFSTREGVDQGPFLSKEIAEQAIEIYTKQHALLNKSKNPYRK